MRSLSYLLFLMVFSFNVSSQEKQTVSGYISDANSGESIIGASVYTDQDLGVLISVNSQDQILAPL